MPVTYDQLADKLRQKYPDKYNVETWSNEDLVRRFVTLDPKLEDYITDLDQLYAPTAEDRGGDVDFAVYQLSEQFNAIPEWFVGSMAAVTGSENLGAWAEEMREESAMWTEGYLTNNPEIAGYLKWIEEEPVTSENWWHAEILQRSLAQAAPSMASMIATDIALIPFTGGVGALVSKAKYGKKFLDTYRGIKTVRKAKRKGEVLAKGDEVLEGTVKWAERGRAVGTASSMATYEASSEYSEAMAYLVDEKGMDPLEAQNIAVASAATYGAISGVLEYMPYGWFKNQFSREIKEKGKVRLLRRVTDRLFEESRIARFAGNITDGAVKNAIMEGGTEWSQFMAQTLIQYGYKHGYGDTEEEIWDELISKATSPEAIGSLHAGMTMGALMGAGGGVVSDISYDTPSGEFEALDEDQAAATVKPEVQPEVKKEPDKDIRKKVIANIIEGNVDNQTDEENAVWDDLYDELGTFGPDASDEVINNWTTVITDELLDPETNLDDFVNDKELFLDEIEMNLGEDVRNEVDNAWITEKPEVEDVVVETEEDVAIEDEVDLPEEGEVEIKKGIKIDIPGKKKKKVPAEITYTDIDGKDKTVTREDAKALLDAAEARAVDMDYAPSNREKASMQAAIINQALQEAPTEVTPEAVHKAAEAAGMAWDDDADFMALSKKVTGKERIDDMTSKERTSLITEIEKAPAEVDMEGAREYFGETTGNIPYKKGATLSATGVAFKNLVKHAASERDRLVKRHQEEWERHRKSTRDPDRADARMISKYIEELTPEAKEYFESYSPGVEQEYEMEGKSPYYFGRHPDDGAIHGSNIYGMDEQLAGLEDVQEAPAEGGLVTLYRGVGGTSRDQYVQEGLYVGSGDMTSGTGFGTRLSTTTDINEAKHYGKEIIIFEVPQSYIDKHGKLNKTHYYVDGKRVEGAEVAFPKGLPAKFAKEAPAEVETIPVTKPLVKVSKLGVKHIPQTSKKDLSRISDEVSNVIDDTEGTTTRKGHKAVWFGDQDYIYTGSKHSAKPIPESIKIIKARIEQALGLAEGYYNSVLMNRLPKDIGIPAHADNEDLLQLDVGVGSVGVLSLGGQSQIDIIDPNTKEVLESHIIGDGDIYELPEGEFQNTFLHAVGPSPEERISLTFRRIWEVPVQTNVTKSAEKTKVNNYIAPNDEADAQIEEENVFDTSEGLDEVNKSEDLKRINQLTHKVIRSLGIVAKKVDIKAWHKDAIETPYANAEEWINSTLEKYTGLQPGVISDKSFNELKQHYHSLQNTISTNNANLNDNDETSGHIIFSTTGEPTIGFNKEKNVETGRKNPKYTRSLSHNPDKDILWIPIKNVFQRFEDIDTGDLSLSKIYQALSAQDLFNINNKLLATGKYTIAFLRGESKLALAPIREEYKKIASDPKALQEYWKNEGFSAKQIKNLTTGTRANELAGNIARYEALKKTYPEFMDDPGGMANVMKRIKIPLTATINVKDMRDVKIKVVNKDKLTLVYPDKTVQAFDARGYKGDGGSYTSKGFFKDINKVFGSNMISRVTKNVISAVTEKGTFFVKHLGYQPQGNALVYENYKKDNQKLIGEFRDGEIYAFKTPIAWSKTKLDQYIKDNNLLEADSKALIDALTDDNADNVGRLSSAVKSILEAPKFKDLELPSLQDQLDFISSKESLLRNLVRNIATQTDLTGEMELIDMLMTSDEAKVRTGEYLQSIDEGSTFSIPGETLGFIHTSEESHTTVPYPDQLNNYIRDPALRQAFVEHYKKQGLRKIGKVFALSRGDNIITRIKDTLVQYLRNRDIESIDDVAADMLEISGLHFSTIGILETMVQKKGIIPSIRMDGQKGISEKIQWDSQEVLEINEVRVSKKNASVIYSAYAEDKGGTAKEASSLDIDVINEWLADENTPDVFLLGYRSPTPHVNGAAMVRVHSIHNSNDVVFMHPYNIFTNFEGDGDGDTFNMVKLPDDLTESYIEFYKKKQKNLKPVNLDKYVDKKKEFDFTKPMDMFRLMSAFLTGKNGISEIAKIQRVYGQLQDVFESIEIEGDTFTLLPATSKRNFQGKIETVEDILRIYLQAAVDNSKYMLLNQWNYSRDQLAISLWHDQNGNKINLRELQRKVEVAKAKKDKKALANATEMLKKRQRQWSVLNSLMSLHGQTGEIRNGKNQKEGIFSLSTQILKAKNYLGYIGYDPETGVVGQKEARESYFRTIASHMANIGEIKFKDGASSQEEMVVLPAISSLKYNRPGNEGTPFRFSDTAYRNAHIESLSSLDSVKEELKDTISKEDKRAAIVYAQRMGSKFYGYFREMAQKGMEVEFLGWSYNEDMIDLLDTHSEEFNKLSDDAKAWATFRFLEGIQSTRGKVKDVMQIPPVSDRKEGATLLDSKIMKKYFNSYTDYLIKNENVDPDNLSNKSKHAGIIVNTLKGGCYGG